jgi:hypothetical protein
MVPSDAEGTSIICAGRDGVIATFDTRSRRKTAQFNQGKDGLTVGFRFISTWTILRHQADKQITALAFSGNDVATGTELENHQAVVSVW